MRGITLTRASLTVDKLIDFTDDPLPISKLANIDSLTFGSKPINKVPKSWTCTTFKAPQFCPSTFEMTENVISNWISENCEYRAAIISDFSKIASNTGIDESVWHVYFENRNDALMFKLQDGHQAWKNR